MITVDIKATQQTQASKERIQGDGSKAVILGNGWNIRIWERHGEAGRPHGKLTQRARETEHRRTGTGTEKGRN